MSLTGKLWFPSTSKSFHLYLIETVHVWLFRGNFNFEFLSNLGWPKLLNFLKISADKRRARLGCLSVGDIIETLQPLFSWAKMRHVFHFKWSLQISQMKTRHIIVLEVYKKSSVNQKMKQNTFSKNWYITKWKLIQKDTS